MVKIIFTLALSALLLSCSGEGQDKNFIGIAMPTQSTARWVADGNYLKEGLEKSGYRVDLQYAENVIDTQISQIENMITKGVRILIIASVDGSSLTNVLEKAKEHDIQVISYDRLILNTLNINYYVTFDNFTVGVLQAKSLLEGLRNRKAPPWNVELFGLSPDDNNAYVFYDGSMSILQPYISDGSIILQSGQEGMDTVAIPRGDSALTQARMDNLIAGFYTDKIVDGVLSPYDGQSIGIISSVKGVGYGTNDQSMPIITGQDCELPSVKAILSGDQYSSIFKDTRELAKITIKMVDSIIKGEKPEVNDQKTYNNGAFVVPSNLLVATIVTKDNLRSVLVDSGYYKKSDIE